MERSNFKKWLIENYPQLKLITINTIVNDAYYIFNHQLGITFEEILSGEKTLQDYKESVRIYLQNKGVNPGTRPSGYTSHLKYLLKFAQSINLTTIEPLIKISETKKRAKVVKSKSFNISEFDIEKAYQQVIHDPIYGEENKALKSILRRYPLHNSIDEIICKISVIDVTHSTHVGIHKKHFSIVDLASKIKNINNIDERLKVGDYLLIDEIANIEGVNMLSFASKYCTCHNQMIYGKDDYYKFDNVVSKTINYRKRNYHEYSKLLDKIIEKNNLQKIQKIREKLDYYFWYNNK